MLKPKGETEARFTEATNTFLWRIRQGKAEKTENIFATFLRRFFSPVQLVNISLENVCGHKVEGLSRLPPCPQMVLNGSR